MQGLWVSRSLVPQSVTLAELEKVESLQLVSLGKLGYLGSKPPGQADMHNPLSVEGHSAESGYSSDSYPGSVAHVFQYTDYSRWDELDIEQMVVGKVSLDLDSQYLCNSSISWHHSDRSADSNNTHRGTDARVQAR